MEQQNQLEQTAQYLLQPLVSTGVFKDETSALKAIVYEYVSSKISTYQASIDTFQEKYEMDFEQFTQQLEGNSTMETDDDWQDWEGALEMKEAWENTLERIISLDHPPNSQFQCLAGSQSL